MTSTLPAPRTPDPMDAPPLRWGVMAPGGIARRFGQSLREGTRQEIVAVGSRSADRAQAYAEEFDVARAHGSYEELVADPGVDIIYVASPHSEHLDQAKLALGAGKPVLVEKAFTRSASEAREVLDLAAAQGLFAMEAMWTRFLPHIDVVRQVLEQGLIGDVESVYADHGQLLWPDGPQRLSDPALAGGALLDLGVYTMSFASFVMGPFASLTAAGSLTDLGVDRQEAVTVTNDAGAVGLLHSTMAARTPCGATICGTKGRLDFGTAFYWATWVRMSSASGEVVGQFDSLPQDAEIGLRYEAAEAARCVASGATESATLPWAETLRVMDAMDEVRAQLGVRYPGE